jgi:hypothetical protein
MRSPVARWRVFFCFNQVAYAVARAEVAADPTGRTRIIYYAQRIRAQDVQPMDSARPFTRVLGLLLVVGAALSSRIEIVVPHPKGGTIVRWIVRVARRLAYVDDGMDSFRTTPRNLDPGRLRPGTTFYALDHSLPLADWLHGLVVRRRCPLRALARDSRPFLDLSALDVLEVESPGLRAAGAVPSGARAGYVVHPNRAKNASVPPGYRVFAGLDLNVERSLASFSGVLRVGESMLLVYALADPDRSYAIEVHLTREQHSNLTALHASLARADRLQLVLHD